jgi:hypothetical protein
MSEVDYKSSSGNGKCPRKMGSIVIKQYHCRKWV